MLDAWKQIQAPIQLRIAGDGDLAEIVRNAAASDPRIQLLGRLPGDQILQQMGQASALVFPSVWYEGQPKTIIESFATGTPVIASNLGSMSDMITPGKTGAHVIPGNATDLAATIERLFSTRALNGMRAACRREFESQYTADANYRGLMSVYESALESATVKNPAEIKTVPDPVFISSANSQR